MPKSKYPQQLDTSIELPPVRENILEVGSEVINSLRSAIFNIEKTLGINPQGAVGNSIAERLNKSLDGNGNLKSDAISRSNFLTGPIIDSDVSRVAGIQEDKLKLDFPTRLLQSEISMLNGTIDSLVSQIESLSLNLSAHLNLNSINRHPATAISTKSYTPTTSSVATMSIQDGDVQTSLQSIYDSHINYDGLNISNTNRSHTAKQIYFDNVDVSLYINSSDTQGAIEEVINKAYNIDVTHQDIMHSNGILRSGYITSSNNAFFGNVLAENVPVTFSASTPYNLYTTVINLATPVALTNYTIEKSDIISLYSSTNPNASYAGDYEILSFTQSGSSVTSITISRAINFNSDSQSRCRISKRIRAESNPTALLVSAREEAGLTSSRTAQICNPNATMVISSGINPLELSASKKYINISINENTEITLDLLYDGNTTQSIDTIVKNINKQCSENAYNFLAYRLDNENKPSELVIACNIPDMEDEKYTIRISRSSDDGIDAAGFSYIEDEIISSKYSTNYFILGKPYSGLGIKLDTKLLNFNLGSITVGTGTSGVNFVSLGIKKFDLLIVTGAESSADNKSFLITDVSSTLLTLSLAQMPAGFLSSSIEDTRFRIFRNIISFENITFDEVSSSTGSMLYDVYLDKNQEIYIDKRFEYSNLIFGINSLITLVDFFGDLRNSQYYLDIVVDPADNHLTLSLDNGPALEVYGLDNYIWLQSGSDFVRFKFYIPDVTLFTSSSNITFYGFTQSNILTNLLISRLPFDNYVGRIVGGNKSGVSITKTPLGIIGSKDISSDALHKLLEIPQAELRSNGVIFGLEISNPDYSGDLYSFDVSSGTCYIGGKRVEFYGKLGFKTNIKPSDYDKIYIGLDLHGNIYIAPSTPLCASPFEESSVCTLAAIEYSNPDIFVTDLRLFINQIDLKLLNAITVSPQLGMGHFTDFPKAIKYAKKFSELYPKAGIPSIHLKSGKHYVTLEFDKTDMTYAEWAAQSLNVIISEIVNKAYDTGLVIDYPVNIIGEGDSSEIILRNKYTFSDTTNIYKGSIYLVGMGYTGTTYASKISSGSIFLSNLKLNKSKITMYDLNIISGTTKHIFNIHLDNITFNNQDMDELDSGELADALRAVEIIEVYDSTNNKGNVSINNCKFIADLTHPTGSAIRISNNTRYKNISITNNKLFNTSTSSALISTNILDADIGSNILILGNMSYSSTDTLSISRTPLYFGGSEWSDRISRDIKIAGVTTSGDFKFNNSKSLYKYYFWGKESKTSEGTVNSSLSFNTQTIGTSPNNFKITSVQMTSGVGASLIIDDLPYGPLIKSIRLGITFPTASIVPNNYTVRLKIKKIDLDISTGIYTITELYNNTTSKLIVVRDDDEIYIFNFSTINTTLSTSKTSFYSIEISHTETVTVGCAYILVEYSSSSLSELLGIV